MNITGEWVYISNTTMECALWAIQRSIANKYGWTQSERDIEPLNWYINTGRACHDFKAKLLDAKPFMVGRILHKGGSYEETIDRVCEYIGFERPR